MFDFRRLILGEAYAARRIPFRGFRFEDEDYEYIRGLVKEEIKNREEQKRIKFFRRLKGWARAGGTAILCGLVSSCIWEHSPMLHPALKTPPVPISAKH